MKKIFILFLICISFLGLNAQFISSDVIASSGDMHESQGYSLSWTLGETITETFVEGDEQFTQGFQQSYLYEITYIPGLSGTDDYTIEVYPNPAEQFFFVKINTEKNRVPLKMTLFNMLGVVVHETSLEPELNTKKFDIDLYPSDMFHLIISDENNQFIGRFKIVKINNYQIIHQQ